MIAPRTIVRILSYIYVSIMLTIMLEIASALLCVYSVTIILIMMVFLMRRIVRTL